MSPRLSTRTLGWCTLENEHHSRRLLRMAGEPTNHTLESLTITLLTDTPLKTNGTFQEFRNVMTN